MKFKKYNSDLDAFSNLKYGDLVIVLVNNKTESVEIFLSVEREKKTNILIFNFFTVKHTQREFNNTHWSDTWHEDYRKLEL